MTRNLDLNTRKENVRSLKVPAKQFTLDEIKQRFDSSMHAIKGQVDLYKKLVEKEKNEDAMFILRSQIVFGEGILDFYIHEVSKYALFHMFNGE